MELNSSTPENHGDDTRPKGGRELVWQPASEARNAEVGAEEPAMIDYLKHPPKGYPTRYEKPPKEVIDKRNAALKTLLHEAFEP